MIRLRFAGLCFALALLPSLASASECHLQFDAARRAWSLAGCSHPNTTDLNGVPTVYVGAKTPLSVTVTQINPLLYVSSLGEITTEKIPAVKDLATMFLEFGGIFKALLAKAAGPAVRADAPGEPADLKEAVEQLNAALALFLQQERSLINAVQRLEFSETQVVAPTFSLAKWDALYRNVRRHLEQDAAAPVSAAVNKEAHELLTKTEDVMKAVAAAKLVARRACVAMAPPGNAATCAEPSGSYTVGRVIQAWSGARGTAWDEIATYPLTLTKQSLYSDRIKTETPETIATKFRIASTQGALFAVGIGLANATVIDSTWAAVASPADPATKVVTLTGQSRRSAVKSLLATYAFTHKTQGYAVRPVLEFGTSLETDKPAAFLGVAATLGRYLRLGAGGTYQRLKELDGQEAGVTPVADDKAIKTRDVWKPGSYWSISFNITALPFFARD